MKQKIEEALRTEFKELGFSDKTIGRLADYIVSKGTVTKEDEIATAVKGDDVKLIAKSIQGEIDGIQKAKKKAEDDLADYKAKHPDKSDPDPDPDPNPDPDPDPGKKGLTPEDVTKMVEAAIEKAVKGVKDDFDAYKAQHAAKEAVVNAKKRFFENKWTTKFEDEAKDAWDRVLELHEAKGGNMTEDEISAKATEYFNKAVKRLGTDATQPFEEGNGGENGKFDFSGQAKYLEGEGLIPKE